jgi:hypothetical protein
MSELRFPATRKELWDAGYVKIFAIPVRPCRLCGKQIEFWLTPQHHKMPLETTPNSRDDSPEKMVCHFETCPHGEQFRGRAKQDPHQQGLFDGKPVDVPKARIPPW